MNKKFSIFVTGLSLAALCTAASADNCSGTYTNAWRTADKQDLGKGITLTNISSLTSSAYNNSDEVRIGSCTGYVLTMADGKSRVVYACACKNKAGDVAVDEGSLEPGTDRGTWKVTSATGALAKTIGDSGWWTPAIDDGKVGIGIFGGTCK